MTVKPVPDGYHTITPHLVLSECARAIEFYKQAFGAEELMRFPGENGTVAHAEIKIGDSVIMVADEFPELGFRSPKSLGSPTGSLMLYVPNVDAAHARALAAGASEIRPLRDEFYGDRTCMLRDPFGHIWSMATHKEDVTPEEMLRRAESQKG